MKNFTLICLIACFALGLTAKTTVTILDANRIKVVWELPAWQLTPQTVAPVQPEKPASNGIPAQNVIPAQAGTQPIQFLWLNATGLPYKTVTGAPLVPYDEIKAAIPPGGAISISSPVITEETIRLEKQLLPVPEIHKTSGTDVNVYKVNTALYNERSAEVIVSKPLQIFRTLQFVPIQINPFSYDGNRTLTVRKTIEFVVTIVGDTRFNTRETMDELTSMMAGTVINPTQAGRWLSSTPRTVNYADFSLSDYWVKIETDKDGMFKILPSQLNTLPVRDIDPRTIRMFTTGGALMSSSVEYQGAVFREIPIWINGETDGTFDAEDYILFYGRDRDGFDMNQVIAGNQYINPYSQNVCYWLTFGGQFTGRPQRIAMVSGEASWQDVATTTPAVVRMESDEYQRMPIGFEWFMYKMFGTQNANYEFTLDLDDVDTSQNQTLSMLVQQEFLSTGSDIAHRMRLNANGRDFLNGSGTTQEWAWTGLSPLSMSYTGNYFQPGSNDFRIRLLRYGTDNLMLDYIQVAYQKKLIKRSKPFTITIPGTYTNHLVRYNFTGSNTELRVFKTSATTSLYDTREIPVIQEAGGFHFVGSGDINTKYQVVQNSEYYTPINIQLIEPTNLCNAAQSYDNVIITPPEFVPQATELVSFYFDKWQKRSKVVLLQDVFNQFSGGMPDPNAIRQFLSYAVQYYPSPALTSVTLLGSGTNDWRNFSGQSDAKNRMICFQNPENASTSDDYFAMIHTDLYPELAVGRYPAKSSNEMTIMLNNLKEYVNNPQPGLWQNNLLFMADDEYNGDSEGEFYHSVQMQDAASRINRSVLVDKLFGIEYSFDEFQNKPKARADMFSAINAGTLIWYYIGHGSFDKLGSEDFLNGAVDMNKFNNPGKLPLFIAASCDVGQFDSFSFDCLGEKAVKLDNKGAISSITGTRETLAFNNVPMFNEFFRYLVDLRNTSGNALVLAKVSYTTNDTNDEKYALLGDPLLPILPPQRDNTISLSTDDNNDILNARERVVMKGTFSAPGLNQTALVQAFNCDQPKTMKDGSPYTVRGGNLFKGNSTLTNSSFSTTFIVPDDVNNGSTGLAMAYAWNPDTQKGYINYLYPITLNDQSVPADSTDTPQINIYLDSPDFRPGGYVGTNTTLTAVITDQNGVNTTDSPGHSILLILDHNSQPVNVTKLFSYETDSYTRGSLTYPLTGLKEGLHTVQLIVFDNFNRPSVCNMEFNVVKLGKIAITDFLPYPNPMKKDGWFTFVLNQSAEVKISVYTIRGKKIRTLKATASVGFNQVYWDGKDADGDYLANNTYFVKITSQALSGKGTAESKEKLIIYH